ncbi:chromate transport protein [Rahnella aquatilis CIP 78.65 = ATCC 33071]|nr:chromate transport protein [Rahnella aquatilis CIP 78.65 = ATCC 33071]
MGTLYLTLGWEHPMTAITAVVVGVILNLALFFGYHVLWPKSFDGGTDWVATVIALAAAVALFRFKIYVVAGCARYSQTGN